MVGILCTSVRKWKNKTCCNESKKEGIKENDKEVNLTMIYCKHFCKCHNLPPVQ
jgi:hypothetical protein